MVKYAAIAIGSVLISCISQVLLKTAAAKEWRSRIREYVNVYVIAGYGLMGVCVLLGIYVMTGLDLKYSAVIESLAYMFMMLLSRLFFREKITRNKWIGNAIIILGVLVFNLRF